MGHAVITGGNNGIGLEVTRLLLASGYDVTVLARDISPVEGLKNCRAIVCNLADVGNISRVISGIDDVDILVNNAGIMNTCTYDNYPESARDEMLKINLEAPVALMTIISGQMMKNKRGRIVNNASIAGQIGHPDIWYGITKAGLINATLSFAKILGPHGIIVNAVAPGPVETGMLQTIPQERRDTVLRSVYRGRFAKAIEVAKTIVWLATDSPEYINGVCIDINNGAHTR